jgi:hypothetical protein
MKKKSITPSMREDNIHEAAIDKHDKNINTQRGNLFVRMYPHSSFVRCLLIHKQSSKSPKLRKVDGGRDFEADDDDDDDINNNKNKESAMMKDSFAASVFITNIPDEWYNERLLRALFSSLENSSKSKSKTLEIVQVKLMELEANKKERGALIVFARSESVKKIWTKYVDKKEQIIKAPYEETSLFGLDKFVQEHRQSRLGGASECKKRIDSWFKSNEIEKEKEERRKKLENENDGWTTVQQKRGRRKTSDNQGTTVGGVRQATAERRLKESTANEDDDDDNDDDNAIQRKKRKINGLVPVENFYKFQSRERRRNDLIQLQRGFMADKAKVLAMKAMRKFKPT